MGATKIAYRQGGAAVFTTVVTFLSAAMFKEFAVADSNAATGLNVIAHIARREDTYDNAGDDMDLIQVNGWVQNNGFVNLNVSSNQRLLGTFQINYFMY